nr:CDP-tyvelose 2-epimerase (EC 5.1.3.-) - Yersinia pseudotuberculosis (fragments) [Yersinia pseudotuberculosis]
MKLLITGGCGYSSTNKVYGDLEQFTYRETDTRYECIEMPDSNLASHAIKSGMEVIVFDNLSRYGSSDNL